jgi:hypothetical protein
MFARLLNLDEADDDDDEDDDLPEYVYVTPSGTKYHYDEDCAGKNATEKKRTSAEKKYDPCKKCVDEDDRDDDDDDLPPKGTVAAPVTKEDEEEEAPLAEQAPNDGRPVLKEDRKNSDKKKK